MKRNILLLTAIVIASVMLSGCILFPWTWGKVDIAWEGDANKVFVKKDMSNRVTKNEDSILEVKYQDGVDPSKVEIVVEGTKDNTDVVAPLLNEDEEEIGKILNLKVGDEKITITVTYEVAEEDAA